MDTDTVGRPARLLVVLAAIMVGSAVVAELVSVKLFEVPFYGWLGVDKLFVLTCGSLLWPLVFVTTDSVNEFYGPRVVRFVTWVTVGMIAWTFVVTTLAIRIPAVGFSPVGDDVFRQVFGQSSWIIVGSISAFVLSQLVDAAVFQQLKKRLDGRMLWARATGSTLVSQLIDSFVVIYIAFWGPGLVGGKGVTAMEALNISLSSFGYKVGVAIALTPVIYLAHWGVGEWLGRDVAERMSREAVDR